MVKSVDKRYKITARHIEHLQSQWIVASNLSEAKATFMALWHNGNVAVANSEIIFEGITREEIKDA